MGNARGTRPSQGHVQFNATGSQRKKYWSFSLHEIGIYDLSTSIDFILKQTNQTQLHYVGYSQGTTLFFILTTARPEYNAKIISMVAMAPAVYMTHSQHTFLNILSRYNTLIKRVLDYYNIYSIDYGNKALRWLAEFACKKIEIESPFPCQFLLFLLDSKLINCVSINIFNPIRSVELLLWSVPSTAILSIAISLFFVLFATFFARHSYNQYPIFQSLVYTLQTSLPRIVHSIPNSASVQQLFHFAQWKMSGIFQPYRYDDDATNRLIYGVSPPEPYNLTQISVPITIIFSRSDEVSNATDVLMLYSQLQNVTELYQVPIKDFKHIDFIYSRFVREFINEKVIDALKLADQYSDVNKCIEWLNWISNFFSHSISIYFIVYQTATEKKMKNKMSIGCMFWQLGLF